MSRWIPLALVLLVGCGSPSKSLDTGRGLYWSWSPERLQRDGYPGSAPETYSSSEWGVLYDDEGLAYGPKSYFEGRDQLEHPYLEVSDTFIQSRWVRVALSDCCTLPLIGHFLEICDLAWVDLTTQLGYRPDYRIHIFPPTNLDEYYLLTGADFARAFVATSNMVIVQPVDVLFRRTLAGHVAYASVAEAIIEMQTHGTAPVWLRRGLASYLAQEGFEHLSFMAEFRPQRESILLTPAQVIADLVPMKERETARVARYSAFLMAWHLSEKYGFDRIVQMLNHMGEGMSFAESVNATYGVDEATLLAAIDPTVLGEPTTTMPGRQ